MSESRLHRELVAALLDDIHAHPWTVTPFIYADSNGAALPPIIGNARPDVYANFARIDRVIIGEAKTSIDLETTHTMQQFIDYFEYLSAKPEGELWLAVPWQSAGTAIRICSCIKERGAYPVIFRVSAWMFGNGQFSKAWHG